MCLSPVKNTSGFPPQHGHGSVMPFSVHSRWASASPISARRSRSVMVLCLLWLFKPFKPSANFRTCSSALIFEPFGKFLIAHCAQPITICDKLRCIRTARPCQAAAAFAVFVLFAVFTFHRKTPLPHISKTAEDAQFGMLQVAPSACRISSSSKYATRRHYRDAHTDEADNTQRRTAPERFCQGDLETPDKEHQCI